MILSLFRRITLVATLATCGIGCGSPSIVSNLTMGTDPLAMAIVHIQDNPAGWRDALYDLIATLERADKKELAIEVKGLAERADGAVLNGLGTCGTSELGWQVASQLNYIGRSMEVRQSKSAAPDEPSPMICFYFEGGDSGQRGAIARLVTLGEHPTKLSDLGVFVVSKTGQRREVTERLLRGETVPRILRFDSLIVGCSEATVAIAWRGALITSIPLELLAARDGVCITIADQQMNEAINQCAHQECCVYATADQCRRLKCDDECAHRREIYPSQHPAIEDACSDKGGWRVSCIQDFCAHLTTCREAWCEADSPRQRDCIGTAKAAAQKQKSDCPRKRPCAGT
jgi:hypothetical protein